MSKKTLLLGLTITTLLTILGDVWQIPLLHYVCKPLIMGLIFLHVRQQFPDISGKSYIRWLWVGMIFALIGDVFLMIRGANMFAAGLSAFLVMQLCYCVIFVKSIHQNGKRITMQNLWLNMCFFAGYVTVFLTVLWPVFSQNSKLTPLWWPVVTYAICLGAMGLLATQRRGLPYYAQVVTGASLFIFSDSMIAINRFLTPVPAAAWLIMLSYAAAQYLIITGLVGAAKTSQESGWSVR